MLSEQALTGGTSSIFPQKDTISVGDTLNLLVQLPKIYVIDSTTKIDMSNASNIGTDINLLVITNPDSLNGAVDSFTYISKAGNSFPNSFTPHKAISINFIETPSFYEFSFSMIANKQGAYLLAVLDVFEAVKKRVKTSIAIKCVNADQHLQLLNIYTSQPSISDITHDYCFYVK